MISMRVKNSNTYMDKIERIPLKKGDLLLSTQIKNYRTEKEFDDFIHFIGFETNFNTDKTLVYEERLTNDNQSITKRIKFDGCVFSELGFFVKAKKIDYYLGQEMWNRAGKIVKGAEYTYLYNSQYNTTMIVKFPVWTNGILNKDDNYEIVFLFPDLQSVQEEYALKKFKDRLLQYFDGQFWNLIEIS